jgi:hypothetical protein
LVVGKVAERVVEWVAEKAYQKVEMSGKMQEIY